MKKIILNILASSIVCMAACNKDDEGAPVVIIPKKNTVGILQAFTQVDADGRLDPMVTIINKRTFGQPDSLYNFTFNAAITDSAATASADIAVTYSVDKMNLAQVNFRRGIAGKEVYELLPDSVVTFTSTSTVIKQGKRVSDGLVFSISSEKIDAGHLYVLPIKMSIADTAQYLVNGDFETAYFVVRPVKIEYADIDRAAWKVLGFDSQEADGEGPENGRAVFALDGDKNTFWHTQWKASDGGPGFPHWISFDLGTSQTIHGISITDRQNATGDGPKNVVFAKSSDGITWTDVVELTLEQTTATQKLDIIPVDNVRYIRITALDNNSGGKYLSVAEIGAY